MKLRSARLGTDTQHLLQGGAIDRSKPLRFRLNGRQIEGFVGDTVLSAVLAAGVDCAGLRDGMPVALSSRHAPAVVLAARAADPQRALPMERLPASDGAEYVTLGRRLGRTLATRLLRRDRNSLGLDLDQPDPLTRPWLGLVGTPGPGVDLVVIGGGVAGMSAALAAAKRGLRVTLLEASPRLGGQARLFGSQDGQESPELAIARLTAAIGKSSKIAVLTSAEAFALRPGVVRLHHLLPENGEYVGRVIDLAAPHIILATGAFERLPVFSGNRLPGVTGVLEAFELAHHYGVWPGKSALFATSSTSAYRLAMLARDAGIDTGRIMDSRPAPQSRFIEYSKAYGITLAARTIVASVVPGQGLAGLAVRPQLAMEELSRAEPELAADRLIASGGWQPDLTLWHMAGGESRWNAASARLEATGAPPGLVLVGSAAGWVTGRACMASGADAVDQLLGRPRQPIEDAVIDPDFETPDAPAPIGDLPADGGQPAFLDGGRGYLARPHPAPARWPAWLPFGPKAKGWSLADTPHPLDIAEVAAGVQLGAIPAASAGIVAQERVAMIGIAQAPAKPADEHAQPLPPPWLEGRHAGAVLFLVAPGEKRALQVGSLIYADADASDPLKAIGVVLLRLDGGAIALVTGSLGQSAWVREPGHVVGLRLLVPWQEGMDLAAALGGSAGTP